MLAGLPEVSTDHDDEENLTERSPLRPGAEEASARRRPKFARSLLPDCEQTGVSHAGIGVATELQVQTTGCRCRPLTQRAATSADEAALERKAALERNTQNRNLSPPLAALQAAHPTADFGSLRFPATRKKASKWVRVPPNVSTETLVSLFTQTWKLRLPPVLISVTGGADNMSGMPDRLSLVFRRGLLAVATKTKAWIVTGGTAVGVMAMVGRTLRESEATCIGVTSWGMVANRQQLADTKGKVVLYEHTRGRLDESAVHPVSGQRRICLPGPSEGSGRSSASWRTQPGRLGGLRCRQ